MNRTLKYLQPLCCRCLRFPGKGLPFLPPGGFQFTGSWNCEGQLRKGQVHRSSYRGDVILGGKWLELVERDMMPTTGYEARYLIGYDPRQKRLFEFDANAFGAATYWSDGGWRDHDLPVVQDYEAGSSRIGSCIQSRDLTHS